MLSIYDYNWVLMTSSLPRFHDRYEYPNQAGDSTAHVMTVLDDYYAASELPLSGHIERAKAFVHEMYWGNILFLEGKDSEAPKVEEPDVFDDCYQAAMKALSDGRSATSCEDDLRGSLSPVFESGPLKQWFPVAVTWLVCAEWLLKAGQSNKAWSALLEYKEAEYHIHACEDEEYDLLMIKRSRESGKQSGKRYHNLLAYFIEFLDSEAPLEGWKTKAHTASVLAPLVYHRHLDSQHKGRYPLTQEETETKLKHWLYNNDDCKAAFETHAKKRRKNGNRA